jgi:hypothetical protein
MAFVHGDTAFGYWQPSEVAQERLSERHSDYHAYSTKSLSKTVFEQNADFFDFSKEIIL